MVVAEVPYARLSGRFQDAVPLPADHRYENKDYIYEASCRSFVYFAFAYIIITFVQIVPSQTMMAKLQVSSLCRLKD